MEGKLGSLVEPRCRRWCCLDPRACACPLTVALGSGIPGPYLVFRMLGPQNQHQKEYIQISSGSLS